MKEKEKSVIGITTAYESGKMSLNRLYCDYVISCGGLPIILPITSERNYFSEVCKVIDGVIFSGGGDIAPLYYGENANSTVSNIIRERDEYELSLIKCILDRNIPFLGICRGIQLINVALGGNLKQHVNGHSETTHEINIKKGTLLYDFIKREKISVNSFHHQALKELGNGLKISAYSDDGQTEAVELENYSFGVGVQWHPERITSQDKICHSLSTAIFSSLIGATNEKNKNYCKSKK